jgi:hypothetical protein
LAWERITFPGTQAYSFGTKGKDDITIAATQAHRFNALEGAQAASEGSVEKAMTSGVQSQQTAVRS